MQLRFTPRTLGLLTIALSLAAGCGSTVVEEKASTQGSGAAGAAGVGGSGGESSSEVSTTGTAGGPTSSSTGVGGEGGTATNCEGLPEAACLAEPACTTVYDDSCCSTCDPGPCADCVNFEFHHCTALASACVDLDCGVVPGWVCTGQEPKCPGPGEQCTSVPGCVDAQCNLQQGPECAPECHPVTSGTCQNMCDSVPPPCPPGTSAENDGFCYTGWCIPDSICTF